MMTFKEYLAETALTSLQNKDIRTRSNSDFDKLGLGKHDGSKPNKKRSTQLSKRQRRAVGYEEEESDLPAIRDRVQGLSNDKKVTGGQRPSPDREFQQMRRRVRRTRGIGSDAKNAMPIDEL